MQLKSIKISGFKSFADKVDIDIKDGITGIVGPNGSGKSNIVDAVKWVLGEQSVKVLRGSKEMSDVIFQGSASRKGLGRASVTLVFDNRDHYLNSDLGDIEIKRVVYQSGENEYFLNNAKVRLKDITDLFLDSGAGKEAFSIISQGKIGEILNSKPEERRSIIEEAAGVLKYKKRKIESLKRLDKTNDNLSKIDLVIGELSVNLEPLKEQAEKARIYQEKKSELENIEISLLVSDITKINDDYEKMKVEADRLRSEIAEIDSTNSKGDAKEEVLKLELLKLENDINLSSQNLLKATEELSKLDAEKQLLVERKKYEVDDVKLESNILNLKEEIKRSESNLSSLVREIETLDEKMKSISFSREDLNVDARKIVASKSSLESEIALKSRMLIETKNKVDIILSNLENDTLLPSSVKQVLNNPRLKGIHGTLGSLIEIDVKYTTAVDTVLGAMQNVVVVDNEASAKNAINYLKDNKLGRVTFFPMNLIKARYVDNDTLEKAKKFEGFIDIAANLVEFKEQYKNIVFNQLGNVLVVRDMDTMTCLGAAINHSYRIVTLDGEILHTGGSLTGGTIRANKNILQEKNNLANLNKEIETLENNIKYSKDKLVEITKEEEIVQGKLNGISASLFKLEEEKKNKTISRSSLESLIEAKKSELSGTIGIKSSTLDQELDATIEKYYKEEERKNTIEANLSKLRSRKDEINTELSEIDLKNKKQNSEYNKKVSTLNGIEVSLGKMDIKLDNLLLRLTEEYNVTYEHAKLDAKEIEDEAFTRDRVQTLRRSIKELGDVNIGAIQEFERINTRFEFLDGQRKDLKSSIENILGVISEMDATMEKEFKETFDKVNNEFKTVFSRLFKGGHGELVLTDPLNLLETGVDIIAEPPGKKLKNITLLSGGEKTLTAIALLFAILNVKVVPFCILDEVEAALDEANVDTFGTYLKEYEHKTQFIVITHKKKTMEYANTLYGITMQESGVSKLVSVKLEGNK